MQKVFSSDQYILCILLSWPKIWKCKYDNRILLLTSRRDVKFVCAVINHQVHLSSVHHLKDISQIHQRESSMIKYLYRATHPCCIFPDFTICILYVNKIFLNITLIRESIVYKRTCQALLMFIIQVIVQGKQPMDRQNGNKLCHYGL